MSAGAILAVCISPGGVPKLPVARARATVDGLEGDGRDHAKHAKPSRAISLMDQELLDDLCAEGYALKPGTIGENLTVKGLNVQGLAVGDVLELSGGVVLELTEMRTPCFVLDPIDPQLKDDIVGRCGFLAKVVREGDISPGETIQVVDGDGQEPCDA